MRGSLDSQLRELQFKQFKEGSSQQKKDFLREHGIIWGGSYVGKYDKASDRVRIDDLINPFNNKVINAIPEKPGNYTEDFPLIVKLWVDQKNKDVTSEDIFRVEMVGGFLDTTKAKQIRSIIKKTKENERKTVSLYGELAESNEELRRLKAALEKEKTSNREALKQVKNYNELNNKYKTVCESNKSIRKDNERLSRIVDRKKSEITQLESNLQQERAVKLSYYQEISRLTEKNKVIAEWYNLVDWLRKEYGFEGFVHYTAYDNLKSIINSGFIVSRREAIRSGINWVDVAEETVLQDTPSSVKDKVRLLYGFNTPISYRFEERAKSRNTEMVAIVIDPGVFLDYQMWFYEKSAARYSYGKSYTAISDLQYFKWDEIFERGWYTPDRDYKKKYRDAEVVLDGRLSTKYITKVYFRSEVFLNRAIAELGEDNRFTLGRVSDKNGQFTTGV